MGKNPIVPFLLIMSLGIGLIFFMSLYGLDQKKEIADGETDEPEVVEEFDGETVAQGKCIACHGDNLEGGAGAPSLVGTDLSKDELVDIIKNGTEGGMPSGLVPNQEEEMADYILSLE